MKKIAFILFYLFLTGSVLSAQAELSETNSMRSNSLEKELSDQVSKTCQLLISASLEQVYPEVVFKSTARQLSVKLDSVVILYANLFTLHKWENWKGFSPSVLHSLESIERLTFSNHTTPTLIYSQLNEAIQQTMVIIHSELDGHSPLLMALILEDIKEAEVAAQSEKSAPKLLPINDPLQDVTLASILPRDHSEIVLNYIIAPIGFSIEVQESEDLTASMSGLSTKSAVEYMVSTNIPEHVELMFKEGEFLLLPTASAQLGELASLLATYEEIRIHITPEFEAIAKPLSMRRMRSVRVKLKRLGLSQTRIAESPEKNNESHPCIHIIVRNE